MNKKYRVFGPDAQVYGPTMAAFYKSINFDNFEAILKENGISDIKDEWYPQQLWLDIFNQIESSEDLVSIGMKITETAHMPHHLLSMPFQEFMHHFNDNYRANNRGADIGSINCIVVEHNHIVMVDKTPYPDEFVYGVYYSLARQFLAGSNFKVTYDPDIPRRGAGGKETRIHITW